jgi:hypothetical protein
MEHYYNNLGENWFTYPNLYKNMVNKFDNAHFVEVGSWKGRSSCFLGVEIFNSGKNIKFDCVDRWTVTEEEIIGGGLDTNLRKNDGLYAEFIKNIEPLRNVIKPIRMSSVDASFLYDDESLDFVFIDAGHDYQSINDDINHWFRKVKVNGVLAGHDYFDSVGVQQSVAEHFGKDFFTSEGCWIYIKK